MPAETKDAELLVLRHENTVLRRRVAGPVRYEPADRFWLAALSPTSPRAIESIRREALDHVLITGEAHARQVLAAHQ
ncbi:hypothetical protein ABZV31_35080 [Streptomyces sp. NPDC005202]|uniref:hypothetical protein n=1 Tax=Streptomyces sp. NPDC005202 TaxID=3157021 RepID=UPI0033A545DD